METQTVKQQTLAEFMAPSRALRIWQIILAVLLSAMILAAAYVFTRPQEEPARMAYSLGSGAYCYVDAQLVSDWILDVSGDEDYTLYEAMDPDGNWFILSLDKAALGKLSEQQAAYEAYFSEDYASYSYPLPVRLTGTTRYLTSDDALELASLYEVEAADVTGYFGSYYLAEGENDHNDGAYPFIAGGVLFGLFFVIAVLQGSGMRKNFQKSENRLYELGLIDEAEREFSSPESVSFPKAKLILARRFFFSGASGWALPYEDIGWIYQRTQRSYGIPVSKQIIAGLTDGKTAVLATRAVNDAVLAETARAVYAANPNCLIGYSGENAGLYRQRVKEYKQSHPK